MDKQSNLVPLLLLFCGSITAFAMAVAIVASFFSGDPLANECLWFAVASAAAVLGWHEVRCTDEHNATLNG